MKRLMKSERLKIENHLNDIENDVKFPLGNCIKTTKIYLIKQQTNIVKSITFIFYHSQSAHYIMNIMKDKSNSSLYSGSNKNPKTI